MKTEDCQLIYYSDLGAPKIDNNNNNNNNYTPLALLCNTLILLHILPLLLKIEPLGWVGNLASI